MEDTREDNDIDFEIQFYEGVLRQKGDFIQALIALGDLYTKRGRFSDGMTVDLKLSRLRPEDPVVLYNLACSYSLMNQVDEAFATIQKAIEYGYDNLEFLENDADLQSLLAQEKFQQYLARLKQKNLGCEKKEA